MSSTDRRNGRALWRDVVAFANRLQLTYYLIRLGELLTAVLPVRVRYAIATAVAYAVYVAWGMLRKQIALNVSQILGEGAEHRRVARVSRDVLRNYVKYLVDFIGLPGLHKDDLERIVHISGTEHVESALQAGKGAIFVGLHCGSFDLVGAALALRGYPVSVIVETFHPPKLDALIQRRRAEKGLTLIPMEAATATRRLLRALQRNELLGLLIDRPSKDEGVPVRFCGAITRVPAGAAALALKTGARLLPGYVIRRADNSLVATILPYIDPHPTGESRRDIQHLTQKLMESLEGFVKDHPDQWYMFREMWPHDLAITADTLATGVNA